MKKILILFLLLASFATAQEIPSPVSGSYVHDFAGVMTPEQRTALHDRLIQLKKKYTVETAIVTVETVGDRGIDDYALRLGREWGVGGKSNNGLVILTAINDRKWRIEIGYGLEGDLTDASSSNLAREYLVPRFKEKNYYQGFMDLIDQIEKYDVLKLEAKADWLNEANKKLCESLPYSSDFPEYKAHVTIAYLKPGTGKKVVERIGDFSTEAVPNKMVYSLPSGDKKILE